MTNLYFDVNGERCVFFIDRPWHHIPVTIQQFCSLAVDDTVSSSYVLKDRFGLMKYRPNDPLCKISTPEEILEWIDYARRK